jgi:CelD/BcsL family acetyltransferase involved in cellulose biosynthesis
MIMVAQSFPLASPPVARDISVAVIEDPGDLGRLQREWDALLGACTAMTPFLGWGWLGSWWRHLAKSASLHVIVVRDGDQLIALAPLMLSRRGLRHAPVLEFLGIAGAGSDYLDVIVRDGHEQAALGALASAVDSLQLPLYLDHLPPSPVAAHLQQALASRGWTAVDSTPDVCPFVTLSGHSWDSYLATLGAAHRANVRRRLRALSAGFDVRFSAVQTDRDRQAALTALIAFNTRRWAERGGSSAFASPALRAFHEDATHAALADGSLRLYMLDLNGVTAAVMYGFSRQQRFYFYQHGFSEEYSTFSVGLVLMALTIKAAIEEGDVEFDMLYGHELYKRLWTREERRLGRLQLFPPRLGGGLLRREVETRQALRAVVRQLGLQRHAGGS